MIFNLDVYFLSIVKEVMTIVIISFSHGAGCGAGGIVDLLGEDKIFAVSVYIKEVEVYFPVHLNLYLPLICVSRLSFPMTS